MGFVCSCSYQAQSRRVRRGESSEWPRTIQPALPPSRRAPRHILRPPRWHRPLTPFSAPTFPILRAKTFRRRKKWEDAFTLNARSGKDYLFTQTWHGRGLHAEMQQQLKVCTLLHLMQRGEGSEVESFHANKSLFSFIRSPKLNGGGLSLLPSPCSLLQCH